jgi:hypothetical protein
VKDPKDRLREILRVFFNKAVDVAFLDYRPNRDMIRIEV